MGLVSDGVGKRAEWTGKDKGGGGEGKDWKETEEEKKKTDRLYTRRKMKSGD